MSTSGSIFVYSMAFSSALALGLSGACLNRHGINHLGMLYFLPSFASRMMAQCEWASRDVEVVNLNFHFVAQLTSCYILVTVTTQHGAYVAVKSPTLHVLILM